MEGKEAENGVLPSERSDIGPSSRDENATREGKEAESGAAPSKRSGDAIVREEDINIQDLFHSPLTLFRLFEPMYRRVAFPCNKLDSEMALTSLLNAVELHQRWDAACYLCVIYGIHKFELDTARDFASFLLPWMMVLIGQSDSKHPLRSVLTLVPEDRPFVHYIMGILILKDLALGKGAAPSPETFHQGVHHLLEFSAQPFDYAPAYLQAAIALESSPLGDVASAVCLYAHAVRAGELPPACYRLATYYFDTKLREGYKSVVLEHVPNDAAALHLLKMAAEQHHSGAQVEYVGHCLERINVSAPFLKISIAPTTSSIDEAIARVTSSPSATDLEAIAKKMAEHVRMLTECINFLTFHLSHGAVMPRFAPLEELDLHRDTVLLLYQFAQCHEKLAAFAFLDGDGNEAIVAEASQHARLAILAYHRALLVQPIDVHLPSALRLYAFYQQEGRGLPVKIDGQEKVIPVDAQLCMSIEKYDRELSIVSNTIQRKQSHHLGDAIEEKASEEDIVHVDWQVKRWTFLQRLLPCASASTVVGAGEVQYQLGICYETGLVTSQGQVLVAPDIVAAIQTWKKAARYEYAPAMLKLVPFFMEGVPAVVSNNQQDREDDFVIKKNILQANQFLYRAAELGLGDAQYAMGMKEEEEALRSASKQLQRCISSGLNTAHDATSTPLTTTDLTPGSENAATNADETLLVASAVTSPQRQSLSRTSSLVNMWSLIHHPHFVLAKQWYQRGVQQSGHRLCQTALLRLLTMEQQAATQQSQQRLSLSQLRSPNSSASKSHQSIISAVSSPEVPPQVISSQTEIPPSSSSAVPSAESLLVTPAVSNSDSHPPITSHLHHHQPSHTPNNTSVATADPTVNHATHSVSSAEQASPVPTIATVVSPTNNTLPTSVTPATVGIAIPFEETFPYITQPPRQPPPPMQQFMYYNNTSVPSSVLPTSPPQSLYYYPPVQTTSATGSFYVPTSMNMYVSGGTPYYYPPMMPQTVGMPFQPVSQALSQPQMLYHHPAPLNNPSAGPSQHHAHTQRQHQHRIHH